MIFSEENLSRVLQLHPTIPNKTVRTWRRRGEIPDKYLQECRPLSAFLTATQIAAAEKAVEKYSMTTEEWRVHTITKQTYKVFNFNGNAVEELKHLLSTPTKVGQKDAYYLKCLMSQVAAIKRKYTRHVIII